MDSLPRGVIAALWEDNMSTLIIERQWESFAAMEAAYEKALADPEWQALGAEGTSIIESDRHELYVPRP